MPGRQIKSPRVTAILNKRLNELGINRSEFIRNFHNDHGDVGAKNHLFKIINGTAIVGERGLLPLIVESLELDFDEVIKAVRADKITHKEWGSAVPKANKTMQEVVTVMETLSKRDQDDILRYAKMRAGQ